MRGAVLALVALASGCVTRSVDYSDDFGTKEVQLRLECDQARMTVPEGSEPVKVRRVAGMPYLAVFAGIAVECRETPPTIVTGGEDVSVVAEGTVLVRRFDGKRTFDEGPYRLVIFRNGQLLTR